MLKIRPVPPAVNPLSISYLTATWLHSGRIRPASGSWGSLATVPFCLAISIAFGPVGLALFGIAAFVGGIYALKSYLPHAEKCDPSEVVIDEVVGMSMMWMFMPANTFWWIALGFVLFRMFDSIKIGPVGWCDRSIKGAMGVITDDAVAGLMAGASLLIIHQAWLAM